MWFTKIERDTVARGVFTSVNASAEKTHAPYLPVQQGSSHRETELLRPRHAVLLPPLLQSTSEICAVKRSWLLIIFWASAMGAMSPSQAGIMREVLGVVANGVNVTLKDQVREVAEVPATVPVSSSVDVPHVVSYGDRNALIQALAQTAADAARNSRRNHYIVLSFVVLAIMFSVVALVATFSKARIIAGICALLAATAVTANIALPFRDDADAYKIVAAHSHALWRDAILNASMRKEDYIEYRRKLEALATYADLFRKQANARQLVRAVAREWTCVQSCGREQHVEKPEK